MNANETNHGRGKAATANAATAKPCRRTDASATGRAGDVPGHAMQRAELALRMKDAIAEEAKQRQIRKPKSVPPTLAEQKAETRDELAKMAGVSHDTIAKVEKIVTQAAPAVVEAADTTGKEVTMQPDEQTQNTPAPLAANGKNAARRKARRGKDKAKIAAAKMRDREIREWLKEKGIIPTGKAVRENRDDYIRDRRRLMEIWGF